MMNKKFHLWGIATVVCCLIIVCLSSCEEKYYEINSDFYKGKQVVVRNPMEGDTLRIEQYNTDQIMLEEPSDSTIVFDNRGFLFTVADETVVTIAEDGTITPISKGVSKVDIVSRANAALSTRIFIEIYKEYQAVEEIRVPSIVTREPYEVDEVYDLPAKGILVFPGNADNKKLHYSMAEASLQYATITDEGLLSVVKSSGRNFVTIQIVSDDNPEAQATIKIQTVTEVLISEVTVLKALDGLTVGVGQILDLNLCTGVLPTNVNVKNRKLTFELLEGQDVLTLNDDGVIEAIGIGTAKLKATSKNGIFKEFTISVATGLTELTRVLWSVATSVSYGYVPDGSTGLPADMFDNNPATFFSVTKPGKTYNGLSTPADHIPYFIVDMKSVQKFNYIRWNHRSGNSNNYLRVWGINFAGSDDGEMFTDIQTDIEIPHDSNAAAIQIAIPESEYRYVKVTLTKWSDNSGGAIDGYTMQIGEFGLGYK
ncbi:MAG: hypothetical protein EZS26_000311 [Candidatus Ordinivivax streblomastigis]|uniref:F5/8 type C domain-containing protein n=1 Tax=Candidatus Ordinivivax streblomastigis TaxID=2540710 RepID=A0A5M8P6C4_9BACT|nr:MAG: hypothetical protein EZS26_000311 [Candidatus Ordinivivax streblomastigis]